MPACRGLNFTLDAIVYCIVDRQIALLLLLCRWEHPAAYIWARAAESSLLHRPTLKAKVRGQATDTPMLRQSLGRHCKGTAPQGGLGCSSGSIRPTKAAARPSAVCQVPQDQGTDPSGSVDRTYAADHTAEASTSSRTIAQGRSYAASLNLNRRAACSLLLGTAIGVSGCISAPNAQASRLPAFADNVWEAMGGGPGDLVFPENFMGTWVSYQASVCLACRRNGEVAA